MDGHASFVGRTRCNQILVDMGCIGQALDAIHLPMARLLLCVFAAASGRAGRRQTPCRHCLHLPPPLISTRHSGLSLFRPRPRAALTLTRPAAMVRPSPTLVVVLLCRRRTPACGESRPMRPCLRPRITAGNSDIDLNAASAAYFSSAAFWRAMLAAALATIEFDSMHMFIQFIL